MFGLKINLEKRIPGLDLARAFAISFVVFSHSLWISENYHPYIKWLMNFLPTIGVEVFFVISGFLIGKIIYRIIQKDDFSFKDVRDFWKRRWLRTLPAYYLVLLLNILLWYIVYHEIPERIGLYFVYLQSFFSNSPDFSRISWSLAVEQFCYILGPILLLFTIRLLPAVDRKKIFLWVICSIIAIVIFIRFWFNESHQLTSMYEWNENLRKVALYRLDAIYYGFLAYYFYVNYPKSINFNKLLFVVGILGIGTLHLFIFYWGISYTTNPGFFNIFFLSLNSIAICCLMPYLLTVKIQSLWVLKIITMLSVLSYSIYLLHYTVILHSMKVLVPSEHLNGIPLLIYTLTYWFIILVFSYLLYRFFEKPMTDLREKK